MSGESSKTIALVVGIWTGFSEMASTETSLEESMSDSSSSVESQFGEAVTGTGGEMMAWTGGELLVWTGGGPTA